MTSEELPIALSHHAFLELAPRKLEQLGKVQGCGQFAGHRPRICAPLDSGAGVSGFGRSLGNSVDGASEIGTANSVDSVYGISFAP